MDEIRNLIFKFANSFDLKEWDALKSVFLDPIVCDYTSLRQTLETLTPEEYVNKRIKSLDKLKTQHIFSNLEITLTEEQATCRCSAIIFRCLETDYFNTHAIYEFTLHHINNVWRIGKIKQQVLWNEGNPAISTYAKVILYFMPTSHKTRSISVFKLLKQL
ncbi:MAG: SnoaL-like domain-containing protein [Legionellales bacterium]|nr:SnoaL-like domain-containing protein [Legionellales bacterium]